MEEEGEAGVEDFLGELGRLAALEDVDSRRVYQVDNVLVELLGKPLLALNPQPVGGGQVLDHGLDHQLEEEPGAVGDVLPRVVPRQGELQGQLLVDQLPKTCASKCCECSKISAWYNLSFFGTSFSDCTHRKFILFYLPLRSCDHCPFQFRYKDFIICSCRKYTSYYHVITSILLNSKGQ